TVDLRPAKLGLPEFAARLRRAAPPVVGYISGGWFKLDLRTVFPRQDDALVASIRAALGS
ncbi:MAG: L-seryl-tRNA(Sec) selenium transferase, partial [Verrucomicrobia bacterium]|nr:L-seryl-tRNA(Sec) selenium transferase [Verrucomicrobiota bacterium]